MDRVCKIPCWNHMIGSHTVLKLYRWTYWPLTPLHDTDVLPWMSIFNLLVNENDFSVPVERHIFLKSRDIILHTSFHRHDKYHYQKLEHVVVMIAWSENATIGRKTISGLNHITSHQLQIIPLIRLILICRCCMMIHHATHNQKLKEKIWILLYKQF